MLIRIERISAQSIHRSMYRCAVPQCLATATWSLVDLGMPASDAANLGERTCCADHIPAAYLSLRGAHLVARAPSADRERESRPGRRRKRRSIVGFGSVLDRRVG